MKHIFDRPTRNGNSMVRHAIEIAKKKMPKKATLALQRRSHNADQAQRVQQYVRIERDIKSLDY